MDTHDRRTRFRALLEGAGSVVPASVFDAISGRIAEDLGFECGVMMGTYSAMSVLGSPDINLLTATELADQCYRICRAGKLPLIVDSDNGFGNALNAMRCVAELERAGVAALTIEDTVIPSPYGSGDKSNVASVEESAARMRAAVAARTDPKLVIFGRTSALASAGLEETVARVKAYSATGVDAIFVAPKTRAHVEAIAAATPLPLMLGSIPQELADAAFLAKNRVRIYMQGHLTLSAAIHAVHETMKAIRAGVPAKEIPNIASADLIKRVTRAEQYDKWDKDFL
jgi:carboxyvinyl-carboxyphosphonate phosphorylmutase